MSLYHVFDKVTVSRSVTTMNGFGNRGGPNGFQASRPPMLRPDNPGMNGKVLVDGYRKDMLNGFSRENPRFNPVSLACPKGVGIPR